MIIIKGKCYYCGKEYSKAGILRHLKSCKSVSEHIGNTKGGKKPDSYIIAISDKYVPSEFWLYVRMDKRAKLSELDRLLRDIWLECCGHLSSFEIYGQKYDSNPANSWEWGEPAESMNIAIGRVVDSKDTIKYEYDFGSTTELVIKVMDEAIFGKRDKNIEIMARNNEQMRYCDRCDKKATILYHENQEFLCMDCAENVEYKEMLQEVDYFNSPRVGVCAYYGSQDDEIPYLPEKNGNESTVVKRVEKEGNVIFLDKHKQMDKGQIEDQIKSNEKAMKEVKNAFRNLMRDFEKSNVKREEKKWNKIDKNSSLENNLNRYTKDELTIIAKNLSIEKISSLKKGELIERINEEYKEKVDTLIEIMSMDDFKLLEDINKLDGIKNIGKTIDRDYESLRYRGLVFTGKIDGELVVMIPEELRSLLKEKNIGKLKKRLKINEEVGALFSGMCYYYGVITIIDFLKILPKYMDCDLTLDECQRILKESIHMIEDIELYGGLGKHKLVDDMHETFKEQNIRTELEYREFTKEELLNINEIDYEEKIIMKTNLYKFITKNYNIDNETAVGMIFTLEMMIKNGERHGDIIQWFTSNFEIEDEFELEFIIQKFMEFYNNTRQWILKGYTPNELRNPQKSIEKEKKVGRNNPCPCGSAKKYKKCCGKN